MGAVFGEHVDWEQVRVLVAKNRPPGRHIQLCPITGLTARYRDPGTGVPYANLRAFRILREVLSHEYVWSEHLGMYVGHEKETGAKGVPEGWGEAMMNSSSMSE